MVVRCRPGAWGECEPRAEGASRSKGWDGRACRRDLGSASRSGCCCVRLGVGRQAGLRVWTASSAGPPESSLGCVDGEGGAQRVSAAKQAPQVDQFPRTKVCPPSLSLGLPLSHLASRLAGQLPHDLPAVSPF